MDFLNENKAVSRQSLAGAGLAAATTQTQQERKPSNTEQALKSLEGVHARLDALVSELERRLVVVLLPVPPSNPRDGQASSMCPLAGKMFNEADLAGAVADRIDSIISRIDL